MSESGSEPSESHGGTQRSITDAPSIAADTIRDGYSRLAENAPYIADVARREAQALADILKEQIDERPYGAIAVAFGIGCLLGRSLRPF